MEWLEPFWPSATMRGEGLFFVQEQPGALPKSNLLFAPEKVLSVRSADERTEYQEGKDYVLDAKAQALVLPAGSRIPFKTAAELKPVPNAPHSIGACVDGKHHLLFSEGHFFHDLQATVTYTHGAGLWKGPVPQFAGEQLPGTLAKLKAKAPLNLVLYGDSISTGANASGCVGVPPHQPGYGPLVAAGLERHYGAQVRLTNLSVGGWSSANGLAQIQKVADAKPDLAILAFGMNDGSGRVPPAKFAATLQKQMAAIRQAQPQAEFILVATMTGNPEWTGAASDLYPKYRDELAKLCGPGVVLADVTSLWLELLKQKKFLDLTGNGVNHPNDFGHRVYAQVVLRSLVQDVAR